MKHAPTSESHPLLNVEYEANAEQESRAEPVLLFHGRSRYEVNYEPGKKGPYPKHIFFILGNEFCERYSYYGMRTILILYLKYFLLYDDDAATVIYHTFTVLCYLWPLVGAFIADSWWGKYNTILYLSIWYAFGMFMVTMGSSPPIGDLTTHKVLSLTGLFIVAMGTGGIKPCVSSFGGDQFKPNQDKYRRSFFSLFYFAINAGSLVSTFVSPIIRDTPCLGYPNCYALAFGIPACLMVIATVFFVIGTPFYTRNPPEGNIFAELCKGIWSAISHRWNHPKGEPKPDNWMDYALVDTSPKMVRDIKYVLHVLLLYVPLPVFWALFDQQGSRWTLQATRMDGYVGDVRIKPDQMQVFNPLLIVTLIPLFEATLYPCLRHYNLNFSPLRRMTLGQVLAGLAFIIAAFCQLQIDINLTVVPDTHSEATLRVINAAQCDLVVTSPVYSEWVDGSVEGSGANDMLAGVEVLSGNATDTIETFVDSAYINQEITVTYTCIDDKQKTGSISFTMLSESVISVVVSDESATTLKSSWYEGEIIKSVSGGGILTVFNALNYPVNISLSRMINDDLHVYVEDEPAKSNDITVPVDMEKNTYTVTAEALDGTVVYEGEHFLDTGAMYSLILQDVKEYGDSEMQDDIVGVYFLDVNPNDINIFWMLPQYFVITLGEVFLSVTGLEFSYTQAPPSMKAVLTSFWLLTVSIGNIIVLIIAESQWVDSQANEYFLFAGLIFIAALIFVYLAIQYEYVDESVFQEKEEDQQPLEEHSFNEDVKYTEGNGKVNEAYYDFNTEL